MNDRPGESAPGQFWYGTEGEAHGPVDREGLIDAFREGRVGPADWLWDEGKNEWKPLRDHPDLIAEARAAGANLDSNWQPEFGGPVPRVAAWVIDQMVLLLPTFLWAFVAIEISGIDIDGLARMEDPFGGTLEDSTVSPEMAQFTQLLHVGSFLIYWIYATLFESSAWQATIGKRSMGLVVTDLEGRRLSPMRAAVRFLAKIPSALSIVGMLMIAFTPSRQGLHDRISATLVLVPKRD